MEWANSNAKHFEPANKMTVLMRLAMPENSAPELTKLMLKAQREDGSWKPGGQFTEAPSRLRHWIDISLPRK